MGGILKKQNEKDMAQVTVTLESETRSNIVKVDEVIILNAPGTKTLDLSEGGHVMTWQMEGEVGEKYTLKLVGGMPPMNNTFTLNDQFDFGFHDFAIQ